MRKRLERGKKEKVGVCKRKEKRNGDVNKMLSKTLWGCYLQTTIKSITQVSATEITRNWWNKTGIQLNKKISKTSSPSWQNVCYAHINQVIVCSEQNISCQNSVLHHAGNAMLDSLNFYEDKTKVKKQQPKQTPNPQNPTPPTSEGWLFGLGCCFLSFTKQSSYGKLCDDQEVRQPVELGLRKSPMSVQISLENQVRGCLSPAFWLEAKRCWSPEALILCVLIVLRFPSYPCSGFSINILKMGSLIVSEYLTKFAFQTVSSFFCLNSKIPMGCISLLARPGDVDWWRSSYPVALSHLSTDDWMVKTQYTFQYGDVGRHWSLSFRKAGMLVGIKGSPLVVLSPSEPLFYIPKILLFLYIHFMSHH